MDQALKQRLIGASILIALAVIFIPMLLDDPVPEDVSDDRLSIPARPEPPVQTRRIAMQPESSGTTGSGRDEARNTARSEGSAVSAASMTPPAPVPPAGESARVESDADDTAIAAGASTRSDQNRNGQRPSDQNQVDQRPGDRVDHDQRPAAAGRVRDEALPVVQNDSATEAAVAVTTAAASEVATTPAPGSSSELITPARTVSSGAIGDDEWSLQVASFSATENAAKLARQLRAMGFNPNLDTVYRGDSPLHRVRVGPFMNRQAAVAAGARISAQVSDLRPRPVAPQNDMTADDDAVAAAVPATAAAARPDESAAGSGGTTADGLARFAVQLGSFASNDNADRLQTRVREAGYSAFVERVDRDQGTRYLVKVGPLLSRNDAGAARDRIDRELGIKGILVDYL